MVNCQSAKYSANDIERLLNKISKNKNIICIGSDSEPYNEIIDIDVAKKYYPDFIKLLTNAINAGNDLSKERFKRFNQCVIITLVGFQDVDEEYVSRGGGFAFDELDGIIELYDYKFAKKKNRNLYILDIPRSTDTIDNKVYVFLE